MVHQRTCQVHMAMYTFSRRKSLWESITEVFEVQYGIHMDPRTAYQRCHELQYNQFGSVQVLMSAMRDYQRIAPGMLTDSVLECILWNKVPVFVQQEIKEITVGSVQELLQKLLHAESVVQERNSWLNNEQDNTSVPRRSRG